MALLHCGVFALGFRGPAPLQPLLCFDSCVVSGGHLISKGGTLPGGISYTPHVGDIRCELTSGYLRQSLFQLVLCGFSLREIVKCNSGTH